MPSTSMYIPLCRHHHPARIYLWFYMTLVYTHKHIRTHVHCSTLNVAVVPIGVLCSVANCMHIQPHTQGITMNTNSNFFAQQMQAETSRVLNGSQTPFKDTLNNAFSTTSNLFAITANATAVGRIQSRAWLLESCHEAQAEAVKFDRNIEFEAMKSEIEALRTAKAFADEKSQLEAMLAGGAQ